MKNKFFKLSIIILVLMGIIIIGCSEMEQEMREKDRIARIEGLLRKVEIFDKGILVKEYQGKMNIETGAADNLCRIIINTGDRFKKIMVKADCIIIEEL